MEQAKIERINALAKKAREEGLTEAEKTEQQQLRQEYIAAMRTNLRAQLENVYLVDESGKETKLVQKDIAAIEKSRQSQQHQDRCHHDHGHHHCCGDSCRH